jgi:hypothetical protein
VIVFPSQGRAEIEWLQREYQTIKMDNESMREVVETAWSGIYSLSGSNFRFRSFTFSNSSSNAFFTDNFFRSNTTLL